MPQGESGEVIKTEAKWSVVPGQSSAPFPALLGGLSSPKQHTELVRLPGVGLASSPLGVCSRPNGSCGFRLKRRASTATFATACRGISTTQLGKGGKPEWLEALSALFCGQFPRTTQTRKLLKLTSSNSLSDTQRSLLPACYQPTSNLQGKICKRPSATLPPKLPK